MPNKEQEYKEHIKELEQQVRLLKEQVDFLTRKLYGTKSEKTSTLEIEGQMSLFNEIESSADPDAPEPDLVEVEKHLRKRKYAGQREELVKNIPITGKLMNAGPAAKKELLIWRKPQCPIPLLCIPWRLRLRLHGSSIKSLN